MFGSEVYCFKNTHRRIPPGVRLLLKLAECGVTTLVMFSSGLTVKSANLHTCTRTHAHAQHILYAQLTDS